MKRSIAVAVLVSAGRHPATNVPRACLGDAVALAVGRRIAGHALRVIYAGQADEQSLQDYLALGAGTIEVLHIEPNQNALPALAAHLKDVDFILTGSRAELGLGSGLLPYALAHTLGRPVIAGVLGAEIKSVASDSCEISARQFLPKGQRRRVACSLPVVISVHPSAPVELSYAFARRTTGRIVPIASTGSIELVSPAPWKVTSAIRRPSRLKAEDKKAGHARLMAAIASETKAGIVAFEGTSVDKAQVVLNYLRDNNLVDF